MYPGWTRLAVMSDGCCLFTAADGGRGHSGMWQGCWALIPVLGLPPVSVS